MSAPESQMEIAHVLFVDIVGYSKRLVNEQTALVRRLNDLVRATEQVRQAESAGKLIMIPTGDGMALVFFTTPDAPVRCAIELSKADQTDPKIDLRMGIHSGPVDRLADVNQRTNIAGAGINMAQRVMDCGDAGHILLSQRIADDLGQYDRWRPHLHDLGEVEVKHGVRLGIVNFCSNGVGNPTLPQKIAARQQERTEVARREQSRQQRKRRTFATALALAVVIALGLSFIAYRMSRRISAADRAAKAASAIPEKSVAVLPFENMSRNNDDVLLTNGLQDEIITRLAKIGALKVISRASTRGLESKPASLAEIAKQLGVSAVLEGTVQKIGEQLRVNVQLIKAANDTHIWAETYDRHLVDVFAVESEIATQVADALQATLSPIEKTRVEKIPTANAQAYTLYRRARDMQVGISDTRSEYEENRRFLEQAVAIEPTFALAHAALSEILTGTYNDLDRIEEIKAAARAHADEALRLDPDLGEAHRAPGRYLYQTERDYVAAGREFDLAKRALPNDAELLQMITLMGRRQGHWRQAIPGLKRAISLDPRDLQGLDWLANTYLDLHEWKLAEEAKQRVVDVAISIGAPPSSILEAKLAVAEANFYRTGRFDKIKEVLNEVAPGDDPEGMVTVFRWTWAMMARDYAEAERVMNVYAEAYIQRAGGTRGPKDGYVGTAVLLEGDFARAKPLLEDSLAFSQSELQKAPLSEQLHMDVAFTCGLLGRKEEAVREGRRAAELLPEAKDARLGTYNSDALATVYAVVGDADEAIALIERLITTPAGISLAELQHAWYWDPIRSDPRFQKIVSSPEPPVVYD
jgi:serine/threonine-protein kinase